MNPFIDAPASTSGSSSSAGNKYAVFPLDRLLQQQLPQHQQVQGSIAATASTDLGNLDTQIREIIFDPNNIYPNENVKYKALRGLIVKFVELNREFREPVRMAIESSEVGADEKHLTKEVRFPQLQKIQKDLNATVGAIFQTRAHKFLTRLLETPEFGWNERGELKLTDEKEAVPGSNVVTLLIDAIRPNRKMAEFPPGYSDLRKIIRRNNISHAFFGNKERYGNFDPLLIAPPARSSDDTAEAHIQQAIENVIGNKSTTGPAKKKSKNPRFQFSAPTLPLPDEYFGSVDTPITPITPPSLSVRKRKAQSPSRVQSARGRGNVRKRHRQFGGGGFIFI